MFLKTMQVDYPIIKTGLRVYSLSPPKMVLSPSQRYTIFTYDHLPLIWKILANSSVSEKFLEKFNAKEK